MSKYTTGELAKRCGVTVRTVQYYDTRGILVPSELSEGGRRLYSEEDLKRMQIICFLRSLGLSIDAIAQLLSEDDPGSVISLLLEQQEAALREEVSERQERLKKLEELRRGLKSVEELSVESIGDIASTMSGKNKLRDLRRDLLLAGLPISVLQWTSIVLWIVRGWWWLFVIWAVLAIPAAVLIARRYYRGVAYICPRCHARFVPTRKDFFFSPHTPGTRKLTCTRCSRRGFCVEVAREEGAE